MRRGRAITPAAAGLAVALLAAPAGAAEGDVEAELSGYLEVRLFGVFGVDEELAQLGGAVDFDAAGFHPDEIWGLQLRLRPTLKVHIGELASVVATAEAHAAFGFFGRAYDSVDDVVGVERLYATLTAGPLDLTLGKQLIRWGYGLFLNPTDLNNTRTTGDLDAELPGQWAARAVFAVSETSNLQLAVMLDEDACCEPVAVARMDGTVDLTDMAGVFAWSARTDELVFGFDLKTEFEVGAWAELSWTWNLELEDWHVDAELGLDYSFDVLQSLYLALEWIYQGDGAGDPWDAPGSEPLPDYFQVTIDSFQSGTRRQLLGTQYLLLLARLGITAQWQLQLLHLLNLRDPSATASLQATWWPHGSWELVAGVQVNYGRQGGEYALVVPSGGLVPEAVQGARITPWALAFLWARFYY